MKCALIEMSSHKRKWENTIFKVFTYTIWLYGFKTL